MRKLALILATAAVASTPALANEDLAKIRNIGTLVNNAFRTVTLDMCYLAAEGVAGMVNADKRRVFGRGQHNRLSLRLSFGLVAFSGRFGLEPPPATDIPNTQGASMDAGVAQG